MTKGLKNNIRLLYRLLFYGHRATGESYVHWLRKKGIRIGGGPIISERGTEIDITRPWLIEIGNHVCITEGVTILTHGFEWFVLQGKYHETLGSAGKVKIGDNVFIGTKSTILKGVTIGDNVIIGANSVVSKNIPSNVVVAGNPANVICSLEEYYIKRKSLQFDEAKELVNEYKLVYKTEPTIDDLHEFFWLFSNNQESLSYKANELLEIGVDSKLTKQKFIKHSPMFSSIDDFLKSL